MAHIRTHVRETPVAPEDTGFSFKIRREEIK